MKVPTSSIILTIFNQENIIENIVKSIIENKSSWVKELIIIFDGCIDNSESIVKKVLENQNISVKYNYADNLYETKCNNIGLKQSTCNYSIIIQDDMLIEEKNFDLRLIKPFVFTDVLAVSSRLAHNYHFVNAGSGYFLEWNNYVGYDPYNLKILPSLRNYFIIRDVVNRGPLVFENEKLQILNYLDESYYPQNLDDHDICLRAWLQHGWVSGSYWIKWTSKEEWGGSRKNQEKYLWFEEYNKKNKQRLFEKYFDYIVSNEKHDNLRIVV